MDFTTKNCGSRTSLKEFEKDLLKEGLLRLKPFFKKDIRAMSLEDFVKNFLGDYNNSEDIETVFAETEEHQCSSDCRRSGGDIFRICKYYYPKCTLEQVLKTLDNLVISNATIGIKPDLEYLKTNVCREIDKRVYVAWECSITNHNKETDEFNRNIGQYNSEQPSDFEIDDEDDDF